MMGFVLNPTFDFYTLRALQYGMVSAMALS
jgi:hypothetical protein